MPKETLPKIEDRQFAAYKEYHALLKELNEIQENNDNYSEKNAPENFPNYGVIENIKGKSIFRGLDGKRGVAEFCFGKQMSTNDQEGNYRYVSQATFDTMVEKLKLALFFLENKNKEGGDKILLG